MKYERFQTIAVQHEGTAKDFRQSLYIKRFGSPPEIANGVCRALSVAYLVKNYTKSIGNQPDAASEFSVPDITKDLQTKKFFEAFSFGRLKLAVLPSQLSQEEGEAHMRRFSAIASIHHQTKRAEKATAAQEATSSELESTQKAMRMMGGDRMRYLGQTKFRKASVAEFPDGQGFWFINVGAHAVAVCFRAAATGGKAKFFDPNNGQATFKTYENCRNFLNTFLREEYPSDAYYTQEFGQ